MFRSAVACLTATAYLMAHTPTVRAASPLTRADYEACQAQDERGFRSAIEALTLKGLHDGLTNLDYGPLVADAWRREKFDETIDRQVDEAIAQVRDESTWYQLWSSLASRERAQELATAAAERVYRSDPIKQEVEHIATIVGKDIGRRIELAVADTSGPAMQCMQAFLGHRYGATVAGVVSADTGREYALDPVKGSAEVGTGQVLVEGKESIAGAVVLVVRRQLANIATRVGQRVVGSVLSRLVSAVAGVIGVALIAKDIWDFRYGVLPIIADEMKSRSAKDKVREEITATLAEQINQSLNEIAQNTAGRVVEIWTDFRRAHAKVLELAERNADFKRLLEAVKPTDLAKLDEITGLVLASEGEPGVVRRLGDGTLYTAVSALPPAALEVARESRSLETALKWSAVAGDKLPQVVELEIHRRAAPDAFTKAGLQRLLGLEDRLATLRLASLSPTTRTALLELDNAALVRLARALEEPQLESLARYLTALSKGAADRVLSVVAQSPARMADLASPRVREAIIASRDQNAAVAMMLEAATPLDPSAPIIHARLVLDGRVSPLLMWEKHAAALVAVAFLGLAFLLMLKRLLFGIRPRIVVGQDAGRGSR